MRHVLLQELLLYENQIGDEGMKSFSEALSRGALPQLVKLILDKQGAPRVISVRRL